jgi:antibiotic biosynthesis monooxygenase (ABM) superfamily enzyme
MYGTVARMRVKPGMEQKLLELSRRADMRGIPGLVAEAIYRLDGKQDEYILVVAFESKEAYLANANSPEQHRRYLELRELLAADPEWNDGEVVDTYRAGR